MNAQQRLLLHTCSACAIPVLLLAGFVMHPSTQRRAAAVPAPEIAPFPPRFRPNTLVGRSQEDGGLRASLARFSVRDLGPTDSSFSVACDVNAFGEVTGECAYPDRRSQLFLTAHGVTVSLRSRRVPSDQATGINDAGQVVGQALTPDGCHAFLYRGGSMRDLGTLGGPASRAWGINNAGDVVGETCTAESNDTRAFLYHDGVMRDLGTLGGSDSEARAINNMGVVVGASLTRSNWFTHAFLFCNGKMEDLGTLGGSNSEARAISDAGAVVGWAHTRDGEEHAFLFREGVMQDLGARGGLSSVAEDVNNAGQVVGSWAPGPAGAPRAFLYEKEVMYDLNGLIPAGSGWRLTVARAINDAGQIVGSGKFRGRSRAFLLTPVRP